MSAYRSAAIFSLTLLLIVGVYSTAQAEGFAADKLCNPYIPKCGCGMVPKVVDGKETCVKGANTFKCPIGICFDDTNDHFTTGICVAKDKCLAQKCDGKDCVKAPGGFSGTPTGDIPTATPLTSPSPSMLTPLPIAGPQWVPQGFEPVPPETSSSGSPPESTFDGAMQKFLNPTFEAPLQGGATEGATPVETTPQSGVTVPGGVYQLQPPPAEGLEQGSGGSQSFEPPTAGVTGFISSESPPPSGPTVENTIKDYFANETPPPANKLDAGRGSPYLAAQRAQLMAELDTNPALRDRVAAVLAKEVWETDGQGRQAVLESMVNRALMRGYTSLDQAISDGFYGPVNRGQVDAYVNSGVSASDRVAADNAIETVRNGSNICNLCTDQGMPNEIKGPSMKIGGESFGYMNGDPRWSNQQRNLQVAYDAAAQPNPWNNPSPNLPVMANYQPPPLVAPQSVFADAATFFGENQPETTGIPAPSDEGKIILASAPAEPSPSTPAPSRTVSDEAIGRFIADKWGEEAYNNASPSGKQFMEKFAETSVRLDQAKADAAAERAATQAAAPKTETGPVFGNSLADSYQVAKNWVSSWFTPNEPPAAPAESAPVSSETPVVSEPVVAGSPTVSPSEPKQTNVPAAQPVTPANVPTNYDEFNNLGEQPEQKSIFDKVIATSKGVTETIGGWANTVVGKVTDFITPIDTTPAPSGSGETPNSLPSVPGEQYADLNTTKTDAGPEALPAAGPPTSVSPADEITFAQRLADTFGQLPQGSAGLSPLDNPQMEATNPVPFTDSAIPNSTALSNSPEGIPESLSEQTIAQQQPDTVETQTVPAEKENPAVTKARDTADTLEDKVRAVKETFTRAMESEAGKTEKEIAKIRAAQAALGSTIQQAQTALSNADKTIKGLQDSGTLTKSELTSINNASAQLNGMSSKLDQIKSGLQNYPTSMVISGMQQYATGITGMLNNAVNYATNWSNSVPSAPETQQVSVTVPGETSQYVIPQMAAAEPVFVPPATWNPTAEPVVANEGGSTLPTEAVPAAFTPPASIPWAEPIQLAPYEAPLTEPQPQPTPEPVPLPQPRPTTIPEPTPENVPLPTPKPSIAEPMPSEPVPANVPLPVSAPVKTGSTNYSGSSVVDFLDKAGMNSSYAARKQLALQFDIQGYRGTAAQNLLLLSKLRARGY